MSDSDVVTVLGSADDENDEDDVLIIDDEPLPSTAAASGQWSCALCRRLHASVDLVCACWGMKPATARSFLASERFLRESSLGGQKKQSVLPLPTQLYGNRVAEELGYAPGAGRGCPNLRSLFHRGFEDDEIDVQVRGGDLKYDRAAILVSSFGFYTPYRNFTDDNNPLVRLASDGTAVTVIDHWHPEENPANMSSSGGVEPHVLVRGGHHRLSSGIQLIHPPFLQHRVDSRTGVWTVKGSAGQPMRPHPSISTEKSYNTYGCVHSKIFLVRFTDGTLRVSITSGNFGEMEWSAMTETLWTQDFPPVQVSREPATDEDPGLPMGGAFSAAKSPEAQAASRSRVEEAAAASAGHGDGLEDVFLYPALCDFEQNLTYGLQRMTVPVATIASFLEGVDFSDARADTVWSQPGYHARSPRRQNFGETPAAGDGKSLKRGREDDVCYKCKMSGHWASDCPKSSDEGTATSGGSAAMGSSATSGPYVYPELPRLRPFGPVRAQIFSSLQAAELDPFYYGNRLSGHMRIRVVRAFHTFAASALINALNEASPASKAVDEIDVLRPQPLIAQSSSLGTISYGDARSWLASSNGFPTDNLERWAPQLDQDLKGQFPEATTKGKSKAASTSRDTAAHEGPTAFALVWPSRETALSTFMPELNRNVCFNTQMIASKGKPAFPRKLLHHFAPPTDWPQRAGLVPHAKTWLPWPQDTRSRGGGEKNLLTLYRQWAFVTSHNTTVSALGSKDNETGGPIRISNWETGALLPPVYRLRLPSRLAGIVRTAAAAGDARPAPRGLTSSESALWDVIGCFKLLDRKPEPFAFPFRVPPVPYGPGDAPWQNPKDGTPDAAEVRIAFQRAIQARSIQRHSRGLGAAHNVDDFFEN